MRTIVWDVDDVLNSLMREWFRQAWMKEHPECAVRYRDLTANPPHLVLGVRREEYLASLDAFRKTGTGIHLEPRAELLDWFGEHGSRFRHIALTARPLESAPDTAWWVLRHFGAWIRCFCVVPSRAQAGAPAYDLGKGDLLRWFGKGDVMVDDAQENLRQAHELGLKTVAWPQPWNNSKGDVAGTLRELTVKAEECD
jgi:FMN phosphatase YigB (HAD superfamily)